MKKCIIAVLLCVVITGAVQALTRGATVQGPGHSEENVSNLSSGTYQFVNFLKGCSFGVNYGLDVQTSSGGSFNNDGYPQVSPTGTTVQALKCSFNTPSPQVGISKSGNNNWFVAWTGTVGSGSGGTGHAGIAVAASAFGGALTNVSDSCSGCNIVANNGGSLYLTGTNGWAKFTPAVSSSISLSFLPATCSNCSSVATGGISGIANIAICPNYLLTGTDAQKAAQCLAAGNTYNPDFLATLRQINPRVLRHTLNSQNMQLSQRSRWAYEPPATSMTFAREQYLVDPALGVWAGTIYQGTGEALNCGGTDKFCVNAPANFPGLADGTTIQGLVLDANTTTSPSLNVGATGDIPVVNYVQTTGPVPGTIGVHQWSANTLNTFVYDGKLNVWKQNAAGLAATEPVSVISSLCNALAKDCWISVPFFFDQASAASLSTAFASSLNSQNLAYIEALGNEDFNAWPNSWLINLSTAIGLPPPSVSISGQLPIARYGDLLARLNASTVKGAWPGGDNRLRVILPDFILRTQIGYEERLVSTAMTFDSGGLFTTGTGAGCSVTGSISSGTFTITSTPSCSIYRGMKVTGSGIPANVVVSDFSTNSLSNVWTSGTLRVSNNQFNVGSESITLATGGTGNAIATDYTQVGQRLGDFIDAASTAMYIQGPNINYSNCFLFPLNCTGSALLTAENITNITSTNPPTITMASPHNYSNGDRVQLALPAGTGFSAVNGAWVTVSSAGSTTFQATNAYNSSGSTAITDFTIFTYGTGGSAQKLSAATNTGAVGLNSGGLLTAADQYASGDPTQMATALSWMSTEVQAGFPYLFNGNSGTGGLNTLSAAAVYWSGQVSKTITVVCYEGGYQGSPMPVNTANQLGISQSYANKITSLMNGYFYSNLYAQDWQSLYNQVVALSNVIAPSNLAQTNVTGITAGITGSISDGGGSNPGNVLSITAGSGLQVGLAINGAGIDPQTTILSFGTGTGGTGTYIVSKSQLVASSSNNIFLTSALVWKYYPGDIYSQPEQDLAGVSAFNYNFLLKRDLDPASNDNDPTWLEKAA